MVGFFLEYLGLEVCPTAIDLGSSQPKRRSMWTLRSCIKLTGLIVDFSVLNSLWLVLAPSLQYKDMTIAAT